MSERNVESMRRLLAAFTARDVDGFVACCDPSVEFYSAFAAVSGALYRGHDGLRRYFRDLEDAWEEIAVVPEALFDLGDDTLSFNVLSGRGRVSGADVAMEHASVARWRDDLVVDLKSYADRAEALSDLGVTEDALQPIEP